MKSEHRHELKTNELAEWISNFPQWAKENLRTIICVSIVAVLAVGAYVWRRYEKNIISVQKQLDFTNLIVQLPRRKVQILQAQAQGLDTSYNLLPIADQLQGSAQNATSEKMAALAFIKEADVLRMELHYRLGTVSEQDLADQIEKAQQCYAEAIALSSDSPCLLGRAMLGSGLCEEQFGNFSQARQIYSDIAADSRFEVTIAAVAAKHRLATMANYQQKPVFKKSSEPAEPIQPEIRIGPSDNQAPPFEFSPFGFSEDNNTVNPPGAK